MERTIKDVVDGLIQQINEYGLKEPTVRLYKDVCRSLINHCNLNVDEPYGNQIPDEFLIKANKCFEEGIHSYEYYRFIKRTIRLLDAFARSGKPNFSHVSSSRKYAPSIEHQDLIEKILDENHLINDARVEMDRIMRHFFCFIESELIGITDLNDNTLLRFIQVASHTKSGSMYRVVRVIRLISDHFKKQHMGKLKMDFSMCQTKSSSVRMIEPYSHDEINRIVKCIKSDTALGMRDLAIILLTFETGLRAIDIVNLKQSDIDWKTAEVHVVQSKTNEILSLPLNGTVMNAVAEYILKARPNSKAQEIFLRSKAPNIPLGGSCALDSILEKYQTLAGVEKKPYRSFHSLRRSFATGLSAAGVPLTTISLMLGHKSIKEARPYLSYDKSQISFCALGFDEIPITDGVYASIHEKSLYAFSERSDD